MLSVIIPSYNEETAVPAAAKAMLPIMTEQNIPCELIFVDDGSQDETWHVVEDLSRQDGRVRGIRFSRNFGKEAAIFAGLESAAGDCCVVMDCDLQHPPETVVTMYRLWQQGYEIVEGVKESRGKETPGHTLASSAFYRIISRLAGFDMQDSSDFKLLDRKVVDTLNAIPEKSTFFRALSYWVGYRSTRVPFRVQDRVAGQSKWSTRSLTRYAIQNITASSSAPLQGITFVGIITVIAAVVVGIIVAGKGAAEESVRLGRILITLLLLIGGVIMIALGVIGCYIANIYKEVKDRPRFIIAERCGGTPS